MKDDFSFLLVHLDTDLIPVFSTVLLTTMSKVKSKVHLIHDGDMVWQDVLLGDPVFTVAAERTQLSFEIFWQLLPDDSSCADREMTSFHETKVPKWASLKIGDILVTCQSCRLGSIGVC